MSVCGYNSWPVGWLVSLFYLLICLGAGSLYGREYVPTRMYGLDPSLGTATAAITTMMSTTFSGRPSRAVARPGRPGTDWGREAYIAIYRRYI